MLRVDHARWDQTPADLRRLAKSASHPRTRERFLALYDNTQESCATRVAERTRRHPQTVTEWLHLYNTRGPEALTYQRTGGRSFCPEIEAGLGETVRAAERAAAGHSRSRSAAALDAQPAGGLDSGAVWPDGSAGKRSAADASPGTVLEESQKAPGQGRPAARAGCRTDQDFLAGAQHGRQLLVYLDEAHIRQDSDGGYGWSELGNASGSPRSRRDCRPRSRSTACICTTKDKSGCGPLPAPTARTPSMSCAGSGEFPEDKLTLVWDGASWHRAWRVREAATALEIELVPFSATAPTSCRSRRCGAGSERM